MSKFHTLRSSVEQRLTEAAQEIFTLFERTIAEYEQELRLSQVENERKQELLDSVLKPQVQLQKEGVLPVSVVKEEVLPELQEWNPSLDQEDPELSCIKEQEKEVEEVWPSEEGEHLQGLEEVNAINVQYTNISVKTENNEKKLESSQRIGEDTDEDCGGSEPVSSFYLDSYLLPISNETNDSDKWTQSSEPESDLFIKMKPPAFSSTTQMETEADKADCEGPEPDMNLNPKIDHGPVLPSQFSESMCGKIFDGKSSLERHKDNTIRFSLNTNLTGHTSYLVETKVTTSPNNKTKINDWGCKMKQNHCSQYGEAFTQKVPAHTGETLFICPVCKKHFAQKNSLMKHMENHTEKPFSCSVCGLRYAFESGLRSHMKVHTEERPFSCPVCKKQFKQSSHVREHMVLHTGEKYVCSVCGKRFSHNSNLHRHIRIHTGEQPFSCTICKKQFSRKSSVQMHMGIHTRMKMLN
ncbi:zinc finger protein 836-like [Sphaeramia orbicularis]|uniref:Zinc finger protein 836-like n=1 Tax=Sphaeramia orbicularis TaxID=375764 RepID=A0A673AG62_9TELE|nr:zinc finger protein 836-like [Sphaeramia orbicularis]